MNYATVLKTLITLQLRQIVAQKRVFLLIMILSFPMFIIAMVTVAMRIAGEEDFIRDELPVIQAMMFLFFYPFASSILLAILYGCSMISIELDRKTLAYLFVRPIPRSVVMIGKYLGVIIGLTVAMVIAVSITWALAGLPGGGRFYFYLLQTSIGGVVVYTALFMMIGMLAPKNAIVVSMFYAVIVEWTFSLIPAMIHSFAVSYHLRSLFLNGVDYMLPKGEKFTEAFGRMEIISELSAAQQWGMLGIFVAVSIIVAGLLVTNREFNMTTDSA